MTNLHVNKQFGRDAAVPVVVFSKASTALVATAAVSISEDRTGQESTGAERRTCASISLLCTENTQYQKPQWSLECTQTHTHTVVSHIHTDRSNKAEIGSRFWLLI